MMILSFKEIDEIRKALNSSKKTILLSPDLGFSKKEYPLSLFKGINFEKIKKNSLYFFDEERGSLNEIALFDKHFYKLEITESGVPSLVIDGFRMHLYSFSPLTYASSLVRKLNPKGKVLDCFGGLGYVSIELSNKVDSVTYIEKNKAVIALSKLNPYSKNLFNNPKIKVVNKDILDFLKDKEKEKYDFIVADAPSFRYKEARYFYSRKFLFLLLKNLKINGRMYFYTGRIAKELISKYLSEFSLPHKFDDKLLGYFVVKNKEINKINPKNRNKKIFYKRKTISIKKK